jgi:hypothetical protein
MTVKEVKNFLKSQLPIWLSILAIYILYTVWGFEVAVLALLWFIGYSVWTLHNWEEETEYESTTSHADEQTKEKKK